MEYARIFPMESCPYFSERSASAVLYVNFCLRQVMQLHGTTLSVDWSAASCHSL